MRLRVDVHSFLFKWRPHRLDSVLLAHLLNRAYDRPNLLWLWPARVRVLEKLARVLLRRRAERVSFGISAVLSRYRDKRALGLVGPRDALT